ncbi:MAG TPA: type II secretion system protein [Nitrospirota bacterium]|nr:type II secretion system protein [Nitrospirota bacterium]
MQLPDGGSRDIDKKSGGFSLIEIIITLVVLSIAMVGILSVFSTGISSSANPLFIDQATQLAQGELDTVIGLKIANGFNSLAAGTGQTCKTNNAMFSGFTCSLAICYVAAGSLNNTSACSTATPYKQVTVTITMPTGQQITAVSLLTNH